MQISRIGPVAEMHKDIKKENLALV
jgi:hypothetical protein